MKRKAITLGIVGMLLLMGFVSFSAVAGETGQSKDNLVEPSEPEDPIDPELEPKIIILGGRGLRIILIGLDPKIGDYVKVEYELNRLGYRVDSYPVVGSTTRIRITNFQLDRGTYSVTAHIDGLTKTKSGFYILGFFL